MRYFFFIALFLITFRSNAQKSVGINFEENLSWAQVKEKAKKENKYIFLDGYTTWCVPCREMAKNIFPLEEVGTFFNNSFISVAVQFDVTDNDNKFVKAWYKDAKMLHETYKVDSYPTYLFLSPDGNLVHYFKGGSRTGAEFISKAKLALKPESQYLNLKLQYQLGKRDSIFLVDLIRTATESNDIAVYTFINEYLSKQKNRLTPQNLKFVSRATTKRTDPGFDIVKNHQGLLDSVAGKGRGREILKTIAFDEIVLPFINGKKTVYGGGMVIYSGDLVKNVNWDKLKKKLDLEYPEVSDQVILIAKPLYYQMLGDWSNFCSSVSLYAADTVNLSKHDLEVYARTVFLSCDDQNSVKEAIKWSEQLLLLADKTKPGYLSTYSELLYKSGEKARAIKSMKEYVTFAPADDYAQKQLEKMKGDEKIW